MSDAPAERPGPDVAVRQIQGARDYQEDAAAWRVLPAPEAEGESVTLLMLADGMGGHAGGAEASRLALEAALEAMIVAADRSEALRAALDAANDAIAVRVDEEPELEGMGCTLVLATVDRSGLRWLSVGDSPLWLVRGGDIRRLNADHSMQPVLDEMVRQGRMTADEAATSPHRSALRSAVTGGEMKLVDAPADPLPLYRDDWVILASDGVETLEVETIAGLVDGADGPEGAAAAILDAVEQAGRRRQDNATVLILRCGEEWPAASAAPAQVEPGTSVGIAAEETEAIPPEPAPPPPSMLGRLKSMFRR